MDVRAFSGLILTRKNLPCARTSLFAQKNPLIKVDLSALAFVTAVATQGRHRSTSNQWVKSYWISYSVDGMTFQEYKINQARKIFIGNLDRETVVRHILSPVIYARFVRFHPNTWNVRICMRVEVYSYGRDFPADLGIEDKEVQDSQLTASSEFDYQHATYMGRLNYQLGIAISWTAKYMNTNQWFQFDLGHTMLVTGVVTQGRGSGDYIQYVKAYKYLVNRIKTFHKYLVRIVRPYDGAECPGDGRGSAEISTLKGTNQ
ncbi:Coagulation factor VIII [Exaiptasia diaphana]|nr:Coagulation factor VIII [Exaiptasia diaphana]